MPDVPLVELIAGELDGADLQTFRERGRFHIDALVRALAKAGVQGADHHAVALALREHGARRVRYGKGRGHRWVLPSGMPVPGP